MKTTKVHVKGSIRLSKNRECECCGEDADLQTDDVHKKYLCMDCLLTELNITTHHVFPVKMINIETRR